MTGVHDEEPDTKKIIIDEDDDMAVDSEALSAIQARRQDEENICKAMFGKSLHEVFSPERIQLGVQRQLVESIKKQLMGVDMMEIFSPERFAKLFKQYCLEQGMAMDLKSG